MCASASPAANPRPKSNWAQIISAVVAFVALVGIYIQVDRTRQNALRASARQVYLAYSQASLKYPRLTFPNYLQLKEAKDPTELKRYEIYVAAMLTAYDEILQIANEPEWIAAFRDMISLGIYLIFASRTLWSISRASRRIPGSF
jgi:hypothetical protein